MTHGENVLGRERLRRLRTGVALLTVGLLVLAACGTDAEEPGDLDDPVEDTDEDVDAADIGDDPPEDEGLGDPQPGGELTFATEVEADCLDPQQTTAAASRRVLGQLFDNLVVQADDGTFQPWLATDWEISDDGTVYTFELRDDVTFHDGTPMNAEAVKFTLDRAVDPATRSPRSAQLLSLYESSEVIDEYTVEVMLQEPFAPLLSALTTEFLAILSPDAYQESVDDVDYCNQATGSGPFVLIERQEGSHVLMERNDDYAWGPPTADNQDAPYIDRLNVQFVPEDSVREGLLQSGEAQVVEGLAPDEAAALADQDEFRILSATQPGASYHIVMNESREPWDQEDMRRAFFQALNVDGMVEVLYLGFFPRAHTVLTSSTLGHHDGLEGAIEFDPDAANAALDAAGWELPEGDVFRTKDGERLVASFLMQEGNRERRTDMGVLMQEQLREVGIDLQLEPVAQSVFLATYQDGDYDVFGHNLVEGDPDALRQLFGTDTISDEESLGFNAGHFSVPEVDELVEEGFVTADEEARAEIYREVQERVIDRAGALPIYESTYILGSRADDVVGVAFDASAFPLFYDAWLVQ